MSVGLNFRGRKALALSLGAGAVLLLAACSKDKELEYKEQSVYEIYSQALGYLDDGQYKDAAKYFDEVERQHPYSVWATKAKLMAAYSLYQNNKYDDAINDLERFIAVHPGNRDVAYAYYLKALCYYEQIADVQRDQELTKKALDALQDVVTRFPGTTYARDARLKIDLTRDHLAGKEMAIGRFYERRVQYLAAINRYKVVIDQYGDTSHSPEALERLTECFTALGLMDEARKTAAVLGYNYPGSDWYKDSYTMVEGVPPPKPSKLAAQQNILGAEVATAVPPPPAPPPTPAPSAVSASAPTPAQPMAQSTASAAASGPAPAMPSAAPAQHAAAPAPETPASPPQTPSKSDGKTPLPWWKLW